MKVSGTGRSLIPAQVCRDAARRSKGTFCEEVNLESQSQREGSAVVADVSAQAIARSQNALAEYRGLTAVARTSCASIAGKGVYLHGWSRTRWPVAPSPARRSRWPSWCHGRPLIYGFSEDAVAAAKVIADFAKSNDKLVIKGGPMPARRWMPTGSRPWRHPGMNRKCCPGGRRLKIADPGLAGCAWPSKRKAAGSAPGNRLP